MNNPIAVVINTMTERSFNLMISIIPMKKAAMPEIPAKRRGIANAKLLKNESPPVCPKGGNSLDKK
jgi:hypothetical protein